MIGPFLCLRSEITREDARRIAEWIESERATGFLGDAPGAPGAIARALGRIEPPVAAGLLNQGGRFFLAECGGAIVGFVRLTAASGEARIVLMVERGRRGRGLGRAILREALEHAFFEMRAPRVAAVIHKGNHRSLRLFARAGFQTEREGGVWTRQTLLFREYIEMIREGRNMSNQITITKNDRERLTRLIDDALFGLRTPDKSFRALRAELDRAIVVEAEKLPANVVSMRSRALIELDGEEEEVALVYPDEENWAGGRLSILSPVGMALLGYREGDRIDWETPGGRKRIEIKKLLYQPEAAGDLHL